MPLRFRQAEIVEIAARDGKVTVEGLAAFKAPSAVDALLGAMADEEEIVRSTALDSVKRLTGEAHPFDPAGSRDARAAGLRRWQR